MALETSRDSMVLVLQANTIRQLQSGHNLPGFPSGALGGLKECPANVRYGLKENAFLKRGVGHW